MKAPKGYVLRIETDSGQSEYVAINSFTVQRYGCGLLAGERIRVKRQALAEPASGDETQIAYPVDEVMEVLLGSDLDPGTVLLERTNGETISWDDDASIFETFERLQ